MEIILNSIIVLGSIGLVLGLGLAFVSKKLAVKIDPLEEKIIEALPGANCGACGFAGCAGYAVACSKGEADIGKCSLGGAAVVKHISEILGKEAEIKEADIAVIACQGEKDVCSVRFSYDGIKDCKAANLVADGYKGCAYACLGFGSCISSCPFDAISEGAGGIPIIDEEKCKGCGKCVKECPKGLIIMVPKRHRVYVLCNSNYKGKVVRKVCKKGCIACAVCVKVCPKEAISIKDNLAIIDYDKCNNCGICVQKCPTKSILSKNLPQQMQLLT